jgi:hypothetical protein
MRPSPRSSFAARAIALLAVAAAASIPAHSASVAAPVTAPGAGLPRALRAERLLDRAWLRARGIDVPSRLAFDDAGGLYVIDGRGRRVVRLALDPASSDRYAEAAADAYGEEIASSWIPADLALDVRGSLLALDRASGSIVAYARRGEALGGRDLDPSLRDEARSAGARLLRDPYGELWLLAPRERDLVSLDDRLRRRRVARYLVPEDSIEAPVAAAFLPRGGGWVADAGRGHLRRFEATGRLAATARPADSLAFEPTDLAADGAGVVYAADAAGGRVIAFGPSGAVAAVHWLTGAGPAWRPGAIAWSVDDRLAVADPARGEIWILAVERDDSP